MFECFLWCLQCLATMCWCHNVMLWKSTFLRVCFELGHLLHVTVCHNLAGLWCKMVNYPAIFSLPSLGMHGSLLLFCLFFRLSLSLWAVAGGSQRKWCGPSGVVVNMLSGERAFGRGHMNPQQNPGVHYNGENHFGGKCLERQQSCGKCFWDKRETTLFSSG